MKSEPTVKAVVGHPLLRALEAVQEYHSPGRASVDHLVQAALPYHDAHERLYHWLENYRAVDPGERRTREQIHAVDLKAALERERPHFDALREERDTRILDLGAGDDPNRTTTPLDRVDNAAVAARQLRGWLKGAAKEALKQDRQAKAFAWDQVQADPELFDKVFQRTRPGGRLMPPRLILSYWRETRSLLSQSGAAELLYPQERDWRSEHEDMETREAAAYFVWERAGRPGGLQTFSRKVGVNLHGIDMDVDPPLRERYHSKEVDDA